MLDQILYETMADHNLDDALADLFVLFLLCCSLRLEELTRYSHVVRLVEELVLSLLIDAPI